MGFDAPRHNGGSSQQPLASTLPSEQEPGRSCWSVLLLGRWEPLSGKSSQSRLLCKQGRCCPPCLQSLVWTTKSEKRQRHLSDYNNCTKLAPVFTPRLIGEFGSNLLLWCLMVVVTIAWSMLAPSTGLECSLGHNMQKITPNNEDTFP